MLTSFKAITAAGFALIIIGAGFLYLSDAVVGTGSWWQATLDAFGVGFIVGGLVDVLAISGLNQVLTLDRTRREEQWRLETAEHIKDLTVIAKSRPPDPEAGQPGRPPA